MHFFINTQYFLGFVQVTKSLYRVLLYTLLCLYARVTIFTSFPPPLGSMSRGSPLINSLTRILGRFITLQVNVSWGSITVIDNILYPIDCSFVLGIVDMVYCTTFGVQNYITSFTIGRSSSTTYPSSFCCIVIWSSYFCRLWVTMRFMFVTILPFFFGKKIHY